MLPWLRGPPGLRMRSEGRQNPECGASCPSGPGRVMPSPPSPPETVLLPHVPSSLCCRDRTAGSGGRGPLFLSQFLLAALQSHGMGVVLPCHHPLQSRHTHQTWAARTSQRCVFLNITEPSCYIRAPLCKQQNGRHLLTLKNLRD